MIFNKNKVIFLLPSKVGSTSLVKMFKDYNIPFDLTPTKKHPLLSELLEIMGIEEPRVGLLNVGEEEGKGTELLKEIYEMLKQLPSFIGNVEGRDILVPKADIYITDGFMGNVVLKLGESLPGILKSLVGQKIKQHSSTPEMLRFVQQVFSEALAPFDYERVGGLPFLGVNGTSVVGHGGSSPTAIKNMIKVAMDCVEHSINDKIIASII